MATHQLVYSYVYVQEGALLSAEPFEAVWEIGPKLGSGAFATVHKCVEKVS